MCDLLLHVQKNMTLHLSAWFVWDHEMFVQVHTISDFEILGSRTELGNMAHLLLASISAATSPSIKRYESYYSDDQSTMNAITNILLSLH
jgi:hypothetical protein